MKSRKIRELSEKVSRFEKSKNFQISDLKDFLKVYLNTPDKSARLALAENFKERRLELCDFLRKNPELISAEKEIFKLADGNFDESSEEKITNFFEIIEENLYDL